jgi:hypothetical protein
MSWAPSWEKCIKRKPFIFHYLKYAAYYILGTVINKTVSTWEYSNVVSNILFQYQLQQFCSLLGNGSIKTFRGQQRIVEGLVFYAVCRIKGKQVIISSDNVFSNKLVNILKLSQKSLLNVLKGRGFDSRWGEFLNLPNPSGRTRPWGLLSL